MGLEGMKLLQESVAQNGIRLHGPTHAFCGDKVIAVSNITRNGSIIIPKDTECLIYEVLIESHEGNGVGFLKRLVLSGYEGVFSPQRFKKK